MTMAYLDLDLAAPGGTAILQRRVAPARAAPVDHADFNQREWTVIGLAREDRLSSLREESEFVEFLRLIFGIRRKPPLSNPKLEALRRMAVLSWHYGYNIDSRDLGAFLAAGYSTDQYDAMLAHMSSERAASTQRRRFKGGHP
jgi:hypothetical protein